MKQLTGRQRRLVEWVAAHPSAKNADAARYFVTDTSDITPMRRAIAKKLGLGNDATFSQIVAAAREQGIIS